MENMNENRTEDRKAHLPVYGVGPVYGAGIILITVAAAALSFAKLIPVFQYAALKIPFTVIGILTALIGFFVWYQAAFRIDKYIISNQLCTDGIYAAVRNPCYSGIMLMCTGGLFAANNLYLLLLPFIYWAAMTILMKNTEEKWLFELYGQEYTDYCKKVNRCIPWFPR